MSTTNMASKPELRLTPNDIRHASLPLAHQGGYDIAAVGHVLEAAADQLEAAQAEIRRLEAVVQRSAQGAKPDVGAETVNLLSRAQKLADKHVSDAEEYAQDLVVTARTQYTEILQKAETKAAAKLAQIQLEADSAPITAPAAAPPVQAVPAPAISPEVGASLQDIEYVRTYTKVAQVQLRAVIDALAEQVDQLGQLPQFTGADAGASQP